MSSSSNQPVPKGYRGTMGIGVEMPNNKILMQIRLLHLKGGEPAMIENVMDEKTLRYNTPRPAPIQGVGAEYIADTIPDEFVIYFDVVNNYSETKFETFKVSVSMPDQLMPAMTCKKFTLWDGLPTPAQTPQIILDAKGVSGGPYDLKTSDTYARVLKAKAQFCDPILRDPKYNLSPAPDVGVHVQIIRTT